MEEPARPDERTLLITFARAASKAQEIEALLKNTVLAADVANDTSDRSFEDIAKEIDASARSASEEIFRKGRERHLRSGL
jgi:hypothetical protein